MTIRCLFTQWYGISGTKLSRGNCDSKMFCEEISSTWKFSSNVICWCGRFFFFKSHLKPSATRSEKFLVMCLRHVFTSSYTVYYFLLTLRFLILRCQNFIIFYNSWINNWFKIYFDVQWSTPYFFCRVYVRPY